MSVPRFLCLEGLDGTGKSTQVQLLAEWLHSRGHRVQTCADPGGTDLGQSLRDLLLSHRSVNISMTTEALLFMASRAELVEQVIRPAIDRGQIVVSDRFLLSNIVYQGYAGGLSVSDLWQMGQFCTAGLLPDWTGILDLPLVAAEQRRGQRRDRLESRDAEFHEKVRQGFLREAEIQPELRSIISAQGSISEVHDRIRQKLQQRFPSI